MTDDNVGRGLFTIVDREGEKQVCVYNGVRKNQCQIDKKYGAGNTRADYVLEIQNKKKDKISYFIDADRTDSDGRYANSHAYRLDKFGKEMTPNCEYRDDGYIWSLRALKAGEEILIDYGKGYKWGPGVEERFEKKKAEWAAKRKTAAQAAKTGKRKRKR